MNYYRRYVGDYARDTTALSLAEHGAYALLLDAYYADEHPLPADVTLLYRICRATTPSEQSAVRSVAERFFAVASDNLRHNARADRELEKAKPAIQAARENGSKGGRRKPAGLPGGIAMQLTHQVSGQEPTGLEAGQHGGLHPPSTNLQPPAASLQEKEKRQERSRGSRLQPGWQPNDVLKAWATQKRPDLDVDATLENFRDYWVAVPGQRGTKLDWDATFRRWVRDQKQGSKPTAIDYEALARKVA